MRCRRATPADVDALIRFPDDPGLVGLPRDQVREDFDAGRMRPQWSWVLEDEGRLVGRALWWGRDESNPTALDALDVLPEVVDPRAAAVDLVRTGLRDLAVSAGSRLPSFTVRLPGSWRDDERASRAVAWRCEALAEVGLTESLERRQYAWTPEDGTPEPTTRVTFRPGSDEEFVELFREAARGSLDVETRRPLESMNELSQAQDDLEFYASCPGERDWWKVARIVP